MRNQDKTTRRTVKELPPLYPHIEKPDFLEPKELDFLEETWIPLLLQKVEAALKRTERLKQT